MNEPKHRNKCQMCYRHIGKFIFDCYCIVCQGCYSNIDHSLRHCVICGKETRHHSINVEDRKQLNRVQHLFTNTKKNLSKCMQALEFQTGVDAKYIRFLETQLQRYKRAVNEVVELNPQLAPYFQSRIAPKKKEMHKSASEHTQLPQVTYRGRPPPQSHIRDLTPPKSVGNASVSFGERQPVRLNQFNNQRNFSGGGYRVPSLNNNTAMRSSKRTSQYSMSQQDDIRGGFFDRKR